VLASHEAALLHGGVGGIRDRGLIESAIARPYLGYRRRIWDKAAALLQSMAMNHGFIDGNKRTALLVLRIFLSRSGYQLSPIAGEDINVAAEAVVLGLVEGLIDLDQLTAWFRDRLIPIR